MGVGRLKEIMTDYNGKDENTEKGYWHRGEGELLYDVTGELWELDYDDMVTSLDEDREYYIKDLIEKLYPYKPEEYNEERFNAHVRVYLTDGIERIKGLVDPTKYGSEDNIDRIITLIVKRYGVHALAVNDIKGFLEEIQYHLVADNSEDFVSILSIKKVVDDVYLIKGLDRNWEEYVRNNKEVKRLVEKEGVLPKDTFLDKIDNKEQGDNLYKKYLEIVEPLL